MAGIWTQEKILALAPDDASAKAGRGLASGRKWVRLGRDEVAVWGECQGSGSKPYQVQIDLSEPAFKCTCPSRKFPCKHGLGLFLLTEMEAGAFKAEAQPQWVADWIRVRSEKSARKSEKVRVEAETPPDPAAQAKRAAERAKKVAGGMQELERWLQDLVRHGLASVQQRADGGGFEKCAARMIDAQAPGAARLLREMSVIPATGDGWHSRLLERAGRLHLLVEGYKRVDALPPPVAADVRLLVGFTQNQDELLATGEPVRDKWLVVGQRVEEEERLRVQRTWLWGQNGRRGALVLAFAHVSQSLDTSLVVGTALDASVVYFPGAYKQRALVKERHEPPDAVDSLRGYESTRAATAAYGAALAQNPWIERFPMAFSAVVPVRRGEDRWAVVDAEGRSLPLSPRFTKAWELLALSGGWPVGLFGEWDGEELLPLGAFAEERFVPL